MHEKNGVILINKSKNFTSFDVIAVLRGVLKTKKIGHAGTLDPMATGVLPVFVGKATKSIQYLENHEKSYVVKMKLGVATDTQDITGRVLFEKNADNLTYDAVCEAIKSFEGGYMQTPPMYSAVKVNGKKLYEYARKGQEVERPAKAVNIYNIEILDHNQDDNTYEFKLFCSKGTFVRTLCHDIGQKLQVGATVVKLERAMACGYELKNCFTIEQIEQLVKNDDYSFLLELKTAFENFSKIIIPKKYEKSFLNGVKLNLSQLNTAYEPEKIYAVYSSDNELLGLAHPKSNVLKIDRIFK